MSGKQQTVLDFDLQLRTQRLPPKTKKHGKSYFLDLPPSIRRRIYRHAGLVRNCAIDLNAPRSDDLEGWLQDPLWAEEEIDREMLLETFVPHGWNTMVKCQGGPDCFYKDCESRYGDREYDCHHDTEYWLCCEPLQTSLLLVNRQIYHEASELLYAETAFRIGFSQMYGFQKLIRMHSQALARLGKLHVSLNLSPRAPHPNLWGWRWGPQDKPINIRELSRCWGPVSSTPRPLKLWLDLLDKLRSAILPGVLELEIDLVTTDTDTADAFLEPLGSLPELKSCAIRLGHRETRLVKHAKMWSERLNSPIRPFQFLHLPIELQERILRFADILRPGVVFSRLEGGLVKQEPCCGTCSHTAKCKVTCFCIGRNGYSPTCTCTTLDFLLYNKSLSAVASRVFLTTNTLVLSHRPGGPDDREMAHYRRVDLEASLLLHDIDPPPPPPSDPLSWLPPAVRPLLRRITLVLDLHSNRYYEAGLHHHFYLCPRITHNVSWPCYGCSDILPTLDFLAAHADLTQLTLSLLWADCGLKSKFHGLLEQKLAMLARMGLRDLWIYMDSQTRVDRAPRLDGAAIVRRKERAWEKRIMGMGYESAARGKRPLMEVVREWYPVEMRATPMWL